MSQGHSIAVLGGPESGKSTYLGMLAEAISRSEFEHLVSGGLDPNASDFIRLGDPLLAGEYPQRTKEERLTLSVPLETRGAVFPSRSFVLRIADYDGEEVERLFKNRTEGWSAEWQARGESSGLLLFLRPSAIKPLAELETRPRPAEHRPSAGERAGFLTRPDSPEDEFGHQAPVPEAPPPNPRKPTDAVEVPTFLAMVELLQFIRHVRGLQPGERRSRDQIRIAVMVTAWDTCGHQSPAEYLADKAPLLEDFLWSNFPEEDVFRFGLSSTGGDLKDPEFNEKFLGRDGPLGYVEWTSATGQRQRRSDISIPILWALLGDRALR